MFFQLFVEHQTSGYLEHLTLWQCFFPDETTTPVFNRCIDILKNGWNVKNGFMYWNSMYWNIKTRHCLGCIDQSFYFWYPPRKSRTKPSGSDSCQIPRARNWPNVAWRTSRLLLDKWMSVKTHYRRPEIQIDFYDQSHNFSGILHVSCLSGAHYNPNSIAYQNLTDWFHPSMIWTVRYCNTGGRIHWPCHRFPYVSIESLPKIVLLMVTTTTKSILVGADWNIGLVWHSDG